MTSLDNTKPIKSRFNARATNDRTHLPTRSYLKKDDIQGRASALTRKATRNYQKQEVNWGHQEYKKLKAKDDERPLDHPKPQGSPAMDRDTQLKIKATKNVHDRYTMRLAKIDIIKYRGIQKSGMER